MNDAKNIITSFVVGVAQFIIGVLILADKADIRTIGYYYVFSATFIVFMALLLAVINSIKNDGKS
jgi:hypothetical protein